MIGTFEIKQGSSAVGQAKVARQGLYYVVSCRCRLTGRGMHRLVVVCGEKQEDLGTLVPMGDEFGLEKRIPVKRLGEGCPHFQLIAKGNPGTRKFAPVYPEEPFGYMSRLKDAYLEAREGQLGLAFRE